MGMDASKALRPLGVAAATAVLLTGAACNGPLARRAANSSGSAPAVTSVAPAGAAPGGATPTTAPSPSAAPVRTEDLEAGLQQADSQLSQTGGAIGTADQNTQQTSD